MKQKVDHQKKEEMFLSHGKQNDFHLFSKKKKKKKLKGSEECLFSFASQDVQLV